MNMPGNQTIIRFISSGVLVLRKALAGMHMPSRQTIIRLVSGSVLMLPLLMMMGARATGYPWVVNATGEVVTGHAGLAAGWTDDGGPAAVSAGPLGVVCDAGFCAGEQAGPFIQVDGGSTATLFTLTPMLTAGMTVHLSTDFALQLIGSAAITSNAYVRMKWFGIATPLSDGGTFFTDFLGGNAVTQDNQFGSALMSTTFTPAIAQCGQSLCVTATCAVGVPQQQCAVATQNSYWVLPLDTFDAGPDATPPSIGPTITMIDPIDCYPGLSTQVVTTDTIYLEAGASLVAAGVLGPCTVVTPGIPGKALCTCPSYADAAGMPTYVAANIQQGSGSGPPVNVIPDAAVGFLPTTFTPYGGGGRWITGDMNLNVTSGLTYWGDMVHDAGYISDAGGRAPGIDTNVNGSGMPGATTNGNQYMYAQSVGDAGNPALTVIMVVKTPTSVAATQSFLAFNNTVSAEKPTLELVSGTYYVSDTQFLALGSTAPLSAATFYCLQGVYNGASSINRYNATTLTGSLHTPVGLNGWDGLFAGFTGTVPTQVLTTGGEIAEMVSIPNPLSAADLAVYCGASGGGSGLWTIKWKL